MTHRTRRTIEDVEDISALQQGIVRHLHNYGYQPADRYRYVKIVVVHGEVERVVEVGEPDPWDDQRWVVLIISDLNYRVLVCSMGQDRHIDPPRVVDSRAVRLFEYDPALPRPVSTCPLDDDF